MPARKSISRSIRWKAPRCAPRTCRARSRSEEHTSELQSRQYLVCRLLLEKKKKKRESSQVKIMAGVIIEVNRRYVSDVMLHRMTVDAVNCMHVGQFDGVLKTCQDMWYTLH